ncbi:hypothetical protein AB0H37_44335, partial [Actinomadura sp. NPDC023710]
MSAPTDRCRTAISAAGCRDGWALEPGGAELAEHAGELFPESAILLGEAAVSSWRPRRLRRYRSTLRRPTGPGWLDDRRARLAEAPRVVPVWLRDRAQLADSAAFVARWYGREWGFHTFRAPVYVGRLWACAPRGGARTTRKWWRWVTDAEARPVEAKAALGDPDAWTRFVTVQSRHTGPRRRASVVVAVPVALLVTLAAVLLPAWTLTAAGAAALCALGWVGRDSDRPIVTRYVAVQLQRRLDSAEVEAALEAIGVKGRIDFVDPIAIDGSGWLAHVDLPGATTAAKVLEKREDLAAAMRRPISTVWPEGDRAAHPGRLRLWVAREDPAKAPRKLWPLMREGQADVFEPLPFGFDPRGNLVTITLMYSNLLVGGIPGSGKTSCALALVLGVALDPTARMDIFELKGSGDLNSVRPVCHRYVSGDDDEDLQAAMGGLRAGIAEQKRRAEFIRGLPASETPEGRRVTRALAEKYPQQDLEVITKCVCSATCSDGRVWCGRVRKGEQPPWIVPDSLWERIEPLLPKVERRKRHTGRKRL